MRVNGEKVPMTAASRAQIQKLINEYGTGKDTLRCLAFGTVGKFIIPFSKKIKSFFFSDAPPAAASMDLIDSKKFASYESGKIKNYFFSF